MMYIIPTVLDTVYTLILFTFFILFLLIMLCLLFTYGPMCVHFAPSAPTCLCSGNSSEGAESVVAGQVGWLSCPLLPSPAQTLTWYRLLQDDEVEQPIQPRYRSQQDLWEVWV